MNTHKILAAAIAVLISCMPVSVAARHTEDTYWSIQNYAEGQEVGTLTYSDLTLPVLYGITQETVDTGNVELFGMSADNHLIMLSHSDKGFRKLYDNSQMGTKINITINGHSTWYEVFNTYWVDEATYYTNEFMLNFYYSDDTPLTLVTCKHTSTTRGRWIVQCTYSSEPVQDEAMTGTIEDNAYLPDETEEIIGPTEEIEVPEPEIIEVMEVVEESPETGLNALNLLKMRRAFVADYIKYNRGL